jgi:transposase
LGAIEDLGLAQVERLAASLLKAVGMDVVAPPEMLSAKDYGHIHAVQGVWDKLGFSEALQKAGIQGRFQTDFCSMVRWMVLNRLCEPCSKLAMLDWLDTIWMLEKTEMAYHQLLRSMDRLISIKEKAEPILAKAVLGKTKAVDMVFYDITSTYFEGDKSIEEQDLRRFGYSRDHRSDRRQVVIGMVVNNDGIPLCHHVFPGNTSDKTTVAQVISDLRNRFNIQRIIFVGDRGMMSDGNLAHIIEENLNFIIAHSVRGNSLAESVINKLKNQINRETSDEQCYEDIRNDLRFVLAFSPKIAEEIRKSRQLRLEKADAWIKTELGKGISGLGRKATPQGAYNRIRDYLRDHNLLKLYHVEITGNQVTVKKNRKALNWEGTIDGMLLLETTDMSLSAQDIVTHYKELAEIERAWRSMKSSLRLRPVYHWNEARIRAHIFICVMALQLERWMRKKLHPISVPKAVQILQKIKIGTFRYGDKLTLFLSQLTPEQKEIMENLGVALPSKHKIQMIDL